MHILSYNPSVRNLKSRFRFWHVESLLNQAADLTDRCLIELKEYNELRYSLTQLNIELFSIEQGLQFDNARLDINERDFIIATIKKELYDQTQSEIANVVGVSQTLSNRAPNSNLEVEKAAVNLAQSKLVQIQREFDTTLNNKQLEYAESDKIYNNNLQGLKQQIYNIKKQESLNNGSLDFKSQLDIIFERMQKSLEFARDRVEVAFLGLKCIYGYELELPTIYKNNNDKTIHELSKWIRDSIEFLVSYQQLDQSFTRMISLFSLMTKKQKSDLKQSTQYFQFYVRVPNYLFEGHDNVRLRGIGGCLHGKVGIIPWSIEVEVPEKAIYRRSGKYFLINQKELPVCLLGRIENRNSLRNIELCGAISLMNASPFAQLESDGAMGTEGLWMFTLKKPENTNESFGEIEDIIIELSLIGKLELK